MCIKTTPSEAPETGVGTTRLILSCRCPLTAPKAAVVVVIVVVDVIAVLGCVVVVVVDVVVVVVASVVGAVGVFGMYGMVGMVGVAVSAVAVPAVDSRNAGAHSPWAVALGPVPSRAARLLLCTDCDCASLAADAVAMEDSHGLCRVDTHHGRRRSPLVDCRLDVVVEVDHGRCLDTDRAAYLVWDAHRRPDKTECMCRLQVDRVDGWRR